MLLKIAQNFAGLVTNAAPDTGAGADPTVITGALYCNGVLDAAVVVTTTDEAASAGITKLTGAIPGTYAEGDIVTLVATATVGGVSSSWPVWHASIVARLPGELALAASVAAIPTTPLLAASYTAPDNAGITAIKAKTDNLPASPAAVGSAMTLTGAYDAAKTAATQTSVNAIPTTPLLDANYTAPPTVQDILTTAMTESYADDNTTMTLAQALYMTWAITAQKGISGTTLTAKKVDGTTTAMTFTLDSATAPTSITRAS